MSLPTLDDSDTFRGPGSVALLSDETTRQLSTYNHRTSTKTVSIDRGQTVVVGEVRATGTIQTLWITFPGWFWQHWNVNAPISQTILKTLILRIYWDGESAPAVESPVGDFFGNGLCQTPNFAAKYFGMTSGGFFCRFPMPFRKGFRIELENRDKIIDTVVFANILYQEVDELPPEAAWFHARFGTGVCDGTRPLQAASVQGRGHWAGINLSMQCKVKNSLHFLEAPEVVYIDDDWESPRYTGTGMEDYFLGGWYFREGEFTGPLHGVTTKDPFRSSVSMYRVHEADAVRFRKRLRWEFFHPIDASHYAGKPVAWSATSFLYLDTPRGAGEGIGSAKELLCWYRIRDCDHVSLP
jgi:hypothetical protein